MLDGAASIERMSRDGSAQTQSLRIGASTTIGNYVLPTLLKEFLSGSLRENALDWKSKVTIANTEGICDAVAAFELDVGLIEGPCHQTSLAVTPWLEDEMVIVTGLQDQVVTIALEGRATGKTPLRRLREMMWLLREQGSGTRDTTDQLLLPHLRSYQRSIELGSSEAIKSAVAEGLGVACLSAWVVGDWLESGRLFRLPTTLPKMTRQCYLVLHRDKQLTPALRNFLALATCKQTK
jgi:DNA-binding transcriptional LysR family regulator